MKVILQEDVKKIGAKGDIVEVADGYGRNYLLPRKLAVVANDANLHVAKTNAENKARKAKQEADEAKLFQYFNRNRPKAAILKIYSANYLCAQCQNYFSARTK